MESLDISTTTTASLTTKRKRTKRSRSLITLPTTASPFPSPSSSSSSAAANLSDEEEDMAYCLILLAQGRALSTPATDKFITSKKFTETTTTTGGKAGFYVYECKTCSKCFSSFQALGGHRASHKKPRINPELDSTSTNDDVEQQRNVIETPSSPTGNNYNSTKVIRQHKCSVCGAEFSSGQALGGHMRRHRPIVPAPATTTITATSTEEFELKKERISLLSLDLNLPAPAEETMSFSQRPMLFSALVDCHY